MSVESQVLRRGDDATSRVHSATSLGVALGTEPGDLAVAVDPVVGIRLAGEAGYLPLLVVGVISQDLPFVVCNPGGSESHFCFCHAALCRKRSEKRTHIA